MLTVSVRKEFLNKDICLVEARKIISEGKVINMNEHQLAREIYFHALAFFFCGKTGLMRKMKTHADPINLHDGGDTLLRRFVYASSWTIIRGKKQE